MSKLREKTTVILLTILFLVIAMAIPITIAKKDDRATIQSGEILTSTGEVVQVGFDEFGYNYQAHLFNGLYDDYDRVHGGDYPDVYLMMKWNDAWLSNKDSYEDDDELLDRHYGFDSYIGSGAWLTNHMWGVNDDGTHWAYFVKIVAVPASATASGGIWYQADGSEIGPQLWGAFAIILEIEQGVIYHSPSPIGFGYYKP